MPATGDDWGAPLPLTRLIRPCYNPVMTPYPRRFSLLKSVDRLPCHAGAGTLLFLGLLLLAGCAPIPELNAAGYLFQRWQAERIGVPMYSPPPENQITGSISGRVVDRGALVAGVSVVLAQADGTPHSAVTDAQGRYRVDGLPPGSYVPAAVGPGYAETALRDRLGVAWAVTVMPGQTVTAPDLAIRPDIVPSLPADPAAAFQLQAGTSYTATAAFPPGAAASVQRFQFQRAGVVNDSLRLYLPLDLAADAQLPILFAVYPGFIDNWESVSVAYASQGFALVAISPAAAWRVDIDQHTLDARAALALARSGALGPHLANSPAVALGGSFSSAILHRLLRAEGENFSAWVTVGGISNAFLGAADFYAGRLQIPEQYALVIPALGAPNLFPEQFLRYSPVYTAGELPPSLVIHTGSDTIIPINQAHELEAALRTAGVPVEVFYYDDVSHYLQIGENMTDTGKQMFFLVRDFARRYGQ